MLMWPRYGQIGFGIPGSDVTSVNLAHVSMTDSECSGLLPSGSSTLLVVRMAWCVLVGAFAWPY